jgi:hypothetical protein
MSKDDTHHFHQQYICNDCGEIYEEEELGHIKIHGFYRLFCTLCQSENVELVK